MIELWRNYGVGRLVADTTGFFDVILMVFLSIVEGRCVFNFSYNRTSKALFVGESLQHGGGDFRLFRCRAEDAGAVLRADIRTLPIECCRVMVGKEKFDELLVSDFGGIELDQNRLGVTGFVGTNLLIGRIVDLAANVANSGSFYTGDFAENVLGLPETAGCENALF